MPQMSDEIRQEMERLIASPWHRWTTACGVKRPWPWQVRNLARFRKGVEATKIALRMTLERPFYPSAYIPNATIEKEDGNTCVAVQWWGDPLRPGPLRP